MTSAKARRWECGRCGWVFDEDEQGMPFDVVPEDWECPVCGALREEFTSMSPAQPAAPSAESAYLREWARAADDVERHMADIHAMADTGRSVMEPMRARVAIVSWDDILIRGAQLAMLPLNSDEPVSTRTVIGPKAAQPMTMDTPIMVSHMSFGALSREAHMALAQGSAAVGGAVCSGEGGIQSDARSLAHRFVFEYVPNKYSVTDENLRLADAIEIKFGQSAKPGMGGHLPGEKVTAEIAAVRGFPPGADIHSPAHFADIRNPVELRGKVAELRERSRGRPIGIKIAAGHVAADIDVALGAGPDFITIDGRAGGTGSAPKFVKMATSVPTVFAVRRARLHLDLRGAHDVSLIVTGGLRVSSDFAKAMALGADAVAIGSAAMMAIGCQQYRVCNTGRCPVGVATQDRALRDRLDVGRSAERLANYLRVSTDELADFARLTGHSSVHDLTVADLCTVSSEISGHLDVAHV